MKALHCLLLIFTQWSLLHQFNNVGGLHHEQANAISRSLPVTRAFSGTITINTTDVLTIDQASVDLVVDRQV